jgi:hypothetical protein
MIVFEEQLERIVNILPSITDATSVVFPMNFGDGTIEELNKFLLLPSSQSKYPLIWLAIGKNQHDEREPSVTRQARIIIATRSLNSNEFNSFQRKNDLDVILMPIANNLLKALQLSGISRYNDRNFTSEFLPNYSVTYREEHEDKTKAQQIDVWNALQLDLNITFYNVTNCIQTNIFN